MKLEVGNIYTISEKLKNAFSVQGNKAKVLSISSGIVMLEIDGKPFPLKQTLAISNLSTSLKLSRVENEEELEDNDERNIQPQDEDKSNENEDQPLQDGDESLENEEEEESKEFNPEDEEIIEPNKDVEPEDDISSEQPQEEIIPEDEEQIKPDEEENSTIITPENNETPQDNNEQSEETTEPWGEDNWNEYNPDEDFL